MASKLHDGSRWERDTVVDSYDDRVNVVSFETGAYLEINEDNYCRCHIDDALAVIRRANLDPLAIAAEALLNALEGCDYVPDGAYEESAVYQAASKLKGLLS